MPNRLGLAALTTALIAAGAVVMSPAGSVGADPGDPPITGTVFRDYDANGERDALEPGFADVTVTAYDSAGGSSTGTVAADGTYSIDVTGLAGGAAGYRVEFTDLPDYMESGPFGPDSGTSVQFVEAGGVANYGVMNPAQYCGSSPELATTCFQGGDTGGDRGAVIDFVYDAGTTSTTSNAEVALTPHADRATASQVGPVRGLAYHRQTDVIFSAAYAKRHSPYPGGSPAAGNDAGPDTIWLVSRDGSAPTPFVTIEAGDDNHDYTTLIDDVAFWNDVGRTAWGDIDLSEDESVLYAANMFDKLIYAIPVTVSGSTPVAGTPTTIDLGALTSIAGDCTNGTWVPGAVKANDGIIYLSATCIADGAGATAADLAGYVYGYDPGTGTATEVASFPLNYERTYASQDFAGSPTASAAFQPWVAAEPARQGALGQVAPPGAGLAPFGQSYYPQPWLTDIEFDEGGNMLVGVTDRFGDQFGNDNTAAASGNGEGVVAGDTLRLLPGGSGTWSLAAADDDFYDGDRYPFNTTTGGHEEISLGHLAVLLGQGEVVTNAFDPAPVTGPVPAPGGGSFRAAFRAGGLIYMSHEDGSRTRSYQIFGLDEPGTFGKASGIGDVELLCDQAPLEIGNYLWIDTDGDGVQDPDEAPVDGATVNLYDSDGELIATVLTDAAGQYYFNDGTPAIGGGTITIEPDTDYTIRLDNPDDYDTGPLSGLGVTIPDQGSDIADSDATTVDGFPEISVTTGGPGQNDHTLDAGFIPEVVQYRIGSLVWEDYDDDGFAEPGERPIPGVLVELLDDEDDVIDSTFTDENGEYEFDELPAGTYRVRVPGDQDELDGLRTSGTPTADADGDVDNDNNGVVDGLDFTSGPVELGDGSGSDEPTSEANGITGASNEDGVYPDGRSNQTVDFGFHRGLRLGNQVWLDTGASTNEDNGIFDDDETGLAGVTVELWLDDGDGVFEPLTDDTLVTTDQTDAEGNYLFDGLDPGTYIVAINEIGLDLLPSSPIPVGDPEEADNDNDGNRDDPSGYLAVSNQVTLSIGGEPLGETDAVPAGEDAEAEADEVSGPYPDGNSNLHVDFGFVGEPPLELGNQLWFDDNNDGDFDDGEPLVPAGVVVELLDTDGNVIATTTTDDDGQYLFTGLAPGDYVVQIPASEFAPGGPLEGYGPSTGPASSTDPEDGVDSNNDGSEVDTGAVQSGVVTLDYGDEPEGEDDPNSPNTPDDSSNLTVDFGFVLTPNPPLELGNQLWFDDDNDGELDDGEPLVPAGVVVELLDTDGNVLASTTTDDQGQYLFTDLDSGDYVVQIPASEFAVGGPLDGYGPSTGPASSTDPEDSVDSNNDGFEVDTGAVQSGVVSLAVGDEPEGEDDPASAGTPDDSSNLTVDFGFVLTPNPPLELGNQLWFDDNNDGDIDDGEPVAPAGVIVELLDTDGNVIATTTTDDDGQYLFTDLEPGDYVVQIPASEFAPGGPLEGYGPSTGPASSTDPEDSVDSNNDGFATAGGAVQSGVVTLAVGEEPEEEDDPSSPSTPDDSSNLTIDFGFVLAPLPQMELGNVVWFDADNDGVYEPGDGEEPIQGVTVRLLAPDGTVLGSTTTDADGEYRFTRLPPGDYVVEIPASNFDEGGPLESTYPSSGPGISDDPNDDVDNNSDGIEQDDGSLRSGVVTLSLGDEPTDETDDPSSGVDDGDSNLTVDFGVYNVSLGDVVWLDPNNNGVRDPGEEPIPGVIVELYDDEGNLIATTTTNADGEYLFTGLPEGTYVVVLPAENTNGGVLEGLESSTGNDGADGMPPDPDDDVNDDDNGFQLPSGEIRSAPVTITASDEPGAGGNNNPTIDFGLTPIVTQQPPPTVEPPPTTEPPQPPPRIPETGSNGSALAPALWLVLAGVAMVLLARRPRRPELVLGA